MADKIDQLISFVQSSLYLCNEAFNELWNITQTPKTKGECDLVSGRPFKFYGVALQYCLIMEYTKLLDTNSSKENENVASLYKLNKSATDCVGKKFDKKFSENQKILKEISRSELCINLKKLRNKKFGHSDGNEINNPWEVVGFSGKQIEEMKVQIQMFLKVFNNVIYEVSDSSFRLHNDTRTTNFIRLHAVYKEYYFKNYFKAVGEGFAVH